MCKIENHFTGIEIYIFGSILYSKTYLNDLDLLIVYNDKIDLAELKDKLCKIGEQVPLDVTYINVEEEREFNFIIGQGAKKPCKV